MKSLIDEEPQERRNIVDSVIVSSGYNYIMCYEDQVYENLINRGLDELIPIIQEVQKFKSEILDPLNKRLTELGYAHQLTITPFVDER